MENTNTIRAWRDPSYRHSLTEAELSAMEGNPAGEISWKDEEGTQPGVTIVVTIIAKCGPDTKADYTCMVPYCI